MTPLLRHDAQPWEGDVPSRPLKLAIIREEFVALTGDPLLAVVLNQLFYWTLRVKDFDLLLEEEKNLNPDCNVSPRHGWIYKTADHLTEETMLRVSRSTMRRYLNSLVEGGWLDERPNPRDKFNKTNQYRVNLRKLQDDLFALGYSLPGFSLPQKESEAIESEITKQPNNQYETPEFQNRTSKFQNETSEVRNETSNVTNCNLLYLNRDYPETINKDHTQSAREFNSFDKHSDKVTHLMVEIWKNHIGQDVIHLNTDRNLQLSSLLRCYFQNSLSEWESFCKRIKATPFLMGQGPRKWRANLDWILVPSNMRKVLEGNYDCEEVFEKKKEEEAKAERERKKLEILESIKDPTWKKWCVQLKDQLSAFELEAISNAWFKEFDGRIVIIGSTDKNALNRIEDLRWPILHIIEKTYPKARNIGTQLEEGSSRQTNTPSCPAECLDNDTIYPQ